MLELIGESFPNEYYKRYLPDLVIQQKPGYVAEALNVEAIVYEQTPYLISIFTAGLGEQLQKVRRSVATVFIYLVNSAMWSMNGTV